MATATAVTPPVLQGPSAKEKKYDRQLRLWAASGQQALENAHILLLNGGSGVVGVETLKNLVLPGTGTFTIVDENIVGEDDLGVNFFLEESSLGKSRAAEACRLLLELNPEVKGFPVQKSIAEFVKKSDLSVYTLILLVAPVSSLEVANQVSDIAWDLRQPLIYVHSTGFYSHFSLQLPPSFPIVDTHPDPASIQDLRLLKPWPELADYAEAQTTNLESFSDHKHGHIPYILLLLHYLERWKEAHNGEFNHRDEKSPLKDFIRDHIRTSNAEGGEENYDEALAAANFALRLPEIPSGLKAVFSEEECLKPRNSVSKSESNTARANIDKSPNFWIIANAISIFVSKHNLLPLPGSVPDMKAQSKDYIALQTLYRKKSQQDTAEITQTVRSLEKKLNRHVPIDIKEIEAFCKGAASVKLIRGKKLLIDPIRKGWNDNSLESIREHATSMNFMTGKPSLFPTLIALFAFDLSVASASKDDPDNNVFARSTSPEFAKQMDTHIQEVFSKFSQGDDLKEALEHTLSVAKEIQRSGAGELHNISSLTGGMVAQEIIKVITKQYVPVDNCCVFDGIESASAWYRL